MALLDILSEDIIKTPLKSTDKYEVIRELLEVLHDSGRLADLETAFQAVQAREAQGSTGLGEGIAIPHAKTTAVKELIMAIGIAPAGIDFDALDGQPSKLFFLILAAPEQSGPHIEALAEIARVTRSRTFLRMILEAKTPKEVLELFEI